MLVENFPFPYVVNGTQSARRGFRDFLFVFVSVLLIPVGLCSKPSEHTPRYKIGLAYRTFTVDGPYNWRAAKTHGLTSVIWYPAVANSLENAHWIGPPDRPLLSAGSAAQDAALVSSPAKFPLILLSRHRWFRAEYGVARHKPEPAAPLAISDH